MRISTTAVTLVHTAIPVALVTAGVLGTAGHTALWLRGLVELWLIISAVVIGCSWLLEAGCVRCGRRLQAHKPDSSKARGTEALESVRAAFIFSCFAAWPRYMLATGRRIAWVWTLAEAQPEAPTSVMLYLVKVFLVTVLVDAYMYWKHRLLHSRLLFPFHASHHKFHNPSPFGGFAVAPVEAVLTFSPVLALCLERFPVLAHANALWVAAFVVLNLYLHAGYSWAPAETMLRAVGLNSSAFHNVHHERTVKNFGELSYVWDSLLGTGAHPPSV